MDLLADSNFFGNIAGDYAGEGSAVKAIDS
jgi:hypothetical protein